MPENYNVNYEDERFAQVEEDKQEALSELEQTYSGMVEESEQHYQDQIDEVERWADQQSQLQQEQTDFAIEQIEQQKQQAQKNYTKEQSGAYVDWRKQSNQYGAEAEKMASSGLSSTGYSESSQVSMYNTYQNRVATAKASYEQAVVSYDNAIKDARLQNNAALAEIAYQALQQQLSLAMESFQYRNQLLLDQAAKKTEVNNTYYNRWMDVLGQINSENALAEQIRQYNESLALQREQLAEEQRQFDAQMAQQQAQQNAGSDGGGSQGTGDGSGGGDGKYEVNTAYYQGDLNPDAKKYGTFSNGYQPKGISGYGALSKTGETIQLSTQVKYGENKGQTQILTQNVWQTPDGSKWYWDGRYNKYIRISKGNKLTSTVERMKENAALN